MFEFYTDEERDDYFGKAPATVYENLVQLDRYPEKLEVLKRNDVFTDSLINSFKLAIMQRWTTDIIHRTILNHADEVRGFKKLHSENALDLDIANWTNINNLRHYVMKDTFTSKSLFTRIKDAIELKDYSLASNLLLELEDTMSKLRSLYSNYTKNLLDI